MLHRPQAGEPRRAEVVVVSTAIKKSNPELMAAREKLLPIVRRAEMLAELMRFRQAVAIAGTHGKTTTTSMVATLLDAGALDPTVVNGGIINAYGTNARMGAGEWMVVEADESDGTFLKLPAEIAIVTNIDPEHLDHYGTFDKVREAFRQFVENVPFYGFGVMCTDHPEVQAMVARIEDRRVITYGANAQADVRFTNHRMEGATSRFDVLIRDRKTGADTLIAELTLPMPGRHNVSNATAAIAVAHELGISADDIKKGLSSLRRRRSAASPTPARGRASRSSTTTATIRSRSRRCSRPPATPRKAASSPLPSRIASRGCTISSTNSPPASTTPTPSPSRRSMRRAKTRSTASTPRSSSTASAPAAIATRATSPSPRQIAPMIRELAKPGDFVVFLGAGNITQWAYALPKELAAGDEAAA